MGTPLKPLTPSQVRSGELSRIGNAAMEKKDWKEAEKKLEEAVKLNKKDVELRRHYAEALWCQGKQQESLNQLIEAIRRGGTEDAPLQLSLAEKYLSIGDAPSGYQHAEQAVFLSPGDPKAWALHGKACWFLAVQDSNMPREEKKRYITQARNDYYRSLSIQPDDRAVLPELAAVQMLSGQPELALATWQNLQSLFPPDQVPADLYRGKAEAYVAINRLDEALACLQAARVREPDQAEIEQRLQEVASLHRQKTVSALLGPRR